MEWNEVKRKHEFNDKGTKNQIKRNKPTISFHFFFLFSFGLFHASFVPHPL